MRASGTEEFGCRQPDGRSAFTVTGPLTHVIRYITPAIEEQHGMATDWTPTDFEDTFILLLCHLRHSRVNPELELGW